MQNILDGLLMLAGVIGGYFASHKAEQENASKLKLAVMVLLLAATLAITRTVLISLLSLAG